jgi:hypothetical protein
LTAQATQLKQAALKKIRANKAKDACAKAAAARAHQIQSRSSGVAGEGFECIVPGGKSKKKKGSGEAAGIAAEESPNEETADLREAKKKEADTADRPTGAQNPKSLMKRKRSPPSTEKRQRATTKPPPRAAGISKREAASSKNDRQRVLVKDGSRLALGGGVSDKQKHHQEQLRLQGESDENQRIDDKDQREIQQRPAEKECEERRGESDGGTTTVVGMGGVTTTRQNRGGGARNKPMTQDGDRGGHHHLKESHHKHPHAQRASNNSNDQPQLQAQAQELLPVGVPALLKLTQMNVLWCAYAPAP